MATPKHPQGGGSITPQTGGGDHPRGTEGKSYVRNDQDQPGERAPTKGDHVLPEGVDVIPDAQRNPGIMSSPGTTDSGEHPLPERDRDAS
jgi:hypothetical protein